jgi:copper chaperone NosL
MRRQSGKYHDFFSQPVSTAARVILLLSLVTLVFVFQYPLWSMSFRSNQYPDPLTLWIHVDHLQGQLSADRDDLREINSLNHYIGMRPLLESDFAEFTWLPFVIGALALLLLRTVVFGRIRDLVDLCVLFIYFGAFSAWDFYNKLYGYGHNLAPDAAIKVAGFTPPMLGEVKIANFWVASYPSGGSYALGAWAFLMLLALALAMFQGWRWYQSARRSDAVVAA